MKKFFTLIFIVFSLNVVFAQELDITQNNIPIPDGGSVAFGSVNIGQSVDKTFTIVNNSSVAPLTISTPIIVTGTGFSCTAQPHTSVASSGGQSSFTIRFQPALPAGAKTGSVSITNDDTNENPYDISLSGTAVSACSMTASITSLTNVACNGGQTGQATVTPANGTGPYTYSWSPSGGASATSGLLSAGSYTVTVTDASSCQATAIATITQPTALSVTAASQTNIACNGGSTGAAAINAATGGAGGYTYNWTPGNPTGDGTISVTGLTAGTWTATVTDANACTASQTFTVTQPTALSVTASSQTNISCFGGSNGAAAINTPTGGAGGYTYNWTPGNPTGDGTTSVTGLSAGTWTATVTDANSCTTTQTFTVTQPTALSVTAASQTNISCFGGSNGAAAINTPTGGAGGYTYNWTPGNPTGDGTTSVTGLSAGTWTATVTDANACTTAQTFTVTQPTALSLTPASQTNIACNGGSTGAAAINAATGGAGGYTYNWTPGNPTGDGTTSVTGLTAGTWTATVTDANACTATQTFTITQPSAVSGTTAIFNVSCNGGSNGAINLTPTGGTVPYTFNWGGGVTTEDRTGLIAGSYSVTITDANLCTGVVNATITQPTAISVTPASQTNISCFGGSNGAAAINTPTGGAGGYTYNWTPGNPTGDGTTSVTGLSAGTWTATVTDANSCTATRTFTVTQPTALSVTAASQTNISCFWGSNGAAAINGATGGAGGYTYNWTPGNPTGDGTTSVTGLSAGTWTATVTDANSCTTTQTFTVTQPSALNSSISASTNPSCGANDGSATVSASGGAGGYTYVWSPSGGTSATASNLAAGTYTCLIKDANDCEKEQIVTLTTTDVIPPVAIAQNITAYLNAAGTVTITGNQINNGSTDNCSITAYSVSPSLFTCASVGAPITVVLTVTDANGNSDTASAIVTVLDTVRPLAIAQNIDVYLNSAGTATITASQINNGSSDACGVAALSLSQTSFTCANVGSNNVTLTVTDNNGNTETASATVTVLDTVRPVVITQNRTVYLSAAGTAIVSASQINNGSSDACGVAALSLSQTSFTCANVGTPVTVTLTVTDVNSNTKTGTATVTVLDTVRPLAIAQNIDVYLNAAGTATITASQINNGSSDACGIQGLSASTTSFTCANVGSNNVILTVTDNNGNTKTANSVVTVLDTVRPVVVTQNRTVYLSAAGTATVSASQINNGSSDACGVAALSLSQTSFTCANVGTPVTVTLTVTDVNSNTKTGTATVTVLDTVRPVVVTQNRTVYLSAAGTATVSASQINNGSSDACGVAALSLSQTSFTCANVGTPVTVTLTVTDLNSNTKTGTATVTVLDTVRPVVVTQNRTVYLSAAGTATVSALQLNNGTSDACGVASLSSSQTSFTCANVGTPVTVTLTATDLNGNTNTGTATVTVLDTVRPVVVTQNRTVYLSAAGTATVSALQLNNGTSDACGVASLSSSQTSFTCADVGTPVTVTLTATDLNGNTNTGTATVTVLDTVRPVVVTQNRTVYLSAAGTATVSASQINNGSSDACGVAALSLSQTSFTCANVGTPVTVTLTVTDVNSNTKTGTATVTVLDTVRPLAIAQNIDVYLNAAGTATVSASQINNGSSDACGVSALSLSQTSFTCANVGSNNVTLTVTDNNGNTKTASAIVTVLDTVRPAVVTQNRTVYLSAAGTATVSASQINNGSSDACGVAALSLSQTSFTCANVGTPVTVTLTVTDVNSNTKTGTATVTVLDTVRPVVVTQNRTVYLSAAGTATVSASQINNGSSDACGVAALSLSQTSFTCANVGTPVTVTLTVTDVNSNTKTGTATVTVLDTVRPVVVTQNRTVYLSAAGTATVSASQINNGSSDACGVAALSLSQTSFTCANVGTPVTVTLTVTDVNSNTKTGTATVTVLDTVRPVAIAQNIDVYLNASGTATITASQINNGSSDACGIAGLSANTTSFTCANVGANTVTLAVTDNNGNIRTANSTVTIIDTIRPVAVAQNLNVYLNAAGTANITATQINNGSSDACGIASLSASTTSFTCANVGSNNVTLTVTDNNGNTRTAISTVTVLDTIRPVAITQNRTIYLDASGLANITATQIDNGSNDACGIASLGINQTSFTCAEVGSNIITLTVTDNNGNVQTATSTITVLDTIAPMIVCMGDTAILDINGLVTITANDVVLSSSDNCSIASTVLSETTFGIPDVGFNTVLITVTDPSGNIRSCQSQVFVVEPAPVAICQNLTVYLDANGNASITPNQVDNGSNSLVGITSMLLSDSSFTCSNIGANTVTLVVFNSFNNSDSCDATITVLDTIRPIALTQNIDLYLDATGNASITASQINNGSNDACGIQSISASQTAFTCANIGANTVILTVTDNNGNIRTANSTVTVIDTIAPIAITQNIDLYLDATGNATITAAQINNGSNDACGIASLGASQTAFTCANIGANTVTLTVTDNNGNVRMANSVVTVIDTIRPIAIAQNINLYLDATGNATITAAQINNGSNDACGIASLDANQTAFTCTNIGMNNILLTVTDNNGNVKTANSVVTVIDTIRPIAVAQNLTVQLNANGTASITAAQVNNGSGDACGIQSLTVSPNSFTCSNIGANTVTLTVTDNNGNVRTANATITVQDNIAPEIVNTPINIAIVSSSSLCGTNVSWTTPSVVENCSATLVGSHVSGSFFNLGLTTISYVATDVVGNTDTSTFTVYVYDTTSPTILNVPANITVNATAGQCSANVTWTAPTAIDNCSATLTGSHAPGANFPIGTTVVTYTAVDPDNNIRVRSFTVTVVDNQAPTIINVSQNIVACQGTVITYGNPVATDNCGASILTRISGFASGIVFPVGVTTVTYQAADLNGNISTASFTVTINANPSAPILTANGATSFCDGGSVVIAANQTTGLLWSNGATTATVTVNQTQSVSVIYTDGNGCVSPASNAIQVTEFAIPNAPVIAANGSTTICEGNVVHIISNQNNGNLWSNGSTSNAINVSNSGAYSTVYTDANGCQSSVSNSITVTVVARPATPIISSTDTLIFCQGSTATLTATGSNIVWSNGTIGNTYVADTTGSYFVVAIGTLQGCNSYESNVLSTIVRENPPVATITKVGANIVSDIQGAYFYDWYLDGALIVSNNNSSIPYTVDGDYQLILRNNFGCTTTSNLLEVNTVGIADITDNQSFLVYPNPSRSDFVFKTTNSSILRLNIYDDKGKLVATYQNRFTEGVRVGENLANGVYIITVEENNQIINTQRIVRLN